MYRPVGTRNGNVLPPGEIANVRTRRPSAAYRPAVAGAWLLTSMLPHGKVTVGMTSSEAGAYSPGMNGQVNCDTPSPARVRKRLYIAP